MSNYPPGVTDQTIETHFAPLADDDIQCIRCGRVVSIPDDFTPPQHPIDVATFICTECIPEMARCSKCGRWREVYNDDGSCDGCGNA
jgi:hypothetical protein